MILFATTPEQKLKLAGFVHEMTKTDLDRKFLAAAYDLALKDQGVYDLFELWAEADNDLEQRDEIISDIQDLLDDNRDAPKQPVQKPYVKFDQLDDVTNHVMKDKATLRQIIDKHGGVSAVAKKTGIPQPSLSRMLNSASIPRRSTLYRIANALDLPETEIAFEWTR